MKMHILATCQYGWPEPYPSLYPMEEMAQRGHYVHAITGTPNYPMGKVFEGYKHNKKIEEKHNGVHITHVPVVARKRDPFHRLLNYHSYPISANKKIKQLSGDYDVVFANQSSPVMMVEPAITYAKKWNKRVVMYCMDLWPASLCIGGVKKDSKIYKYYYHISKKIYNSVDVLLVTSRLFKDYFIAEFGVEAAKIDYLPQYALSEFTKISDQPVKDTIDLIFAGNVGAAQNLKVILRAAKVIRDKGITGMGKKIQFHIIGDGQELGNLQKYAKEYEISNVIFHGRKPPEDMPGYYSLADAMLVTMKGEPLVSLTLPAKVQSYMAAGKPIIASADGEIANVIRESQCGFCSKANDVEGLVKNIQAFIASQEIDVFGIKAKQYYEENFEKNRLMDRLEGILLENCKYCKKGVN